MKTLPRTALRSQQILLVLSATSVALALTACGGGGGGAPAVDPNAGGYATPGGSGIYATPSTPTTVAVVTVAPAAPVGYNAEQTAAYNTINTARNACGFGYLQQNTHLDTGSLNHVIYMVDNNAPGHYETAGLPGYTGVYPGDRMTAAGYTNLNGGGEVAAMQSGSSKVGFGALFTRGLLGAPYHLMGMMQGNREIGISVDTGGPIASGSELVYAGANPAVWIVEDMAASTTLEPQVQASSTVLTYPCQGVTGTVWETTTESPNPVPARNLAAYPIGQPVFVQVLAGHTLVISSATMTGPTGSVALLPTMTPANDPNSELQANQALIIPNAPLSPTTVYTVNITGTNSGTPFTTNFTFTTGA